MEKDLVTKAEALVAEVVANQQAIRDAAARIQGALDTLKRRKLFRVLGYDSLADLVESRGLRSQAMSIVVRSGEVEHKLMECALSRVLGKDWAHEARMAEALERASTIRPGMTRAEVERIFPTRDGGLQSMWVTRYYEEPEIIVEVAYQRIGKADCDPRDRVESSKGNVKLYRAGFSTD